MTDITQHNPTVQPGVRVGIPPIGLPGPDAVAAALPYLLGFQPEHSIVLLWLEDDRLQLVQRVDLPDTALGDLDRQSYVDALLTPGCQTGARRLIACIVTPHSAGDAAGPLPFASLVDTLAATLVQRDHHLLEALLVAREGSIAAESAPDSATSDEPATRWWSFLCTQGCCPRRGRLVPASVSLAVAAAFTLEGVAVARSRTDVARSMSGEPALQAKVGRRLRKRSIPSGSAQREQWRQARIEHVRILLGLQAPGQSPSAYPDPESQILNERDLADLLHGLMDVRVRDCLLWSLSRTADLRHVLALLLQGLRAAPPAYRAPIATTLAIGTWLLGDGARASIALEQALTADPAYTLARLLDVALRSGMPPARWSAMMADLSEAQCRGAQDAAEPPEQHALPA